MFTSHRARSCWIILTKQHKDTVTTLPPDFHLLLKSDKYPIHSMIKYHPSSSASSTSDEDLARILTIQGHPEFTPSIVSHVIDTRVDSGVFDPRVAEEAKRRMGGKDGSGGEGLGRVGWAIWRVMLQEIPA
jgi:GMP synthase-like glutamine amidotransferase